jgi:hypothetical protein
MQPTEFSAKPINPPEAIGGIMAADAALSAGCDVPTKRKGNQ